MRVYCSNLDECFTADCPEELELLGAAYNIDPADPDNVLDQAGELNIEDPVEYRECKSIIKGF